MHSRADRPEARMRLFSFPEQQKAVPLDKISPMEGEKGIPMESFRFPE
jgi:hypothetical protein